MTAACVLGGNLCEASENLQAYWLHPLRTGYPGEAGCQRNFRLGHLPPGFWTGSPGSCGNSPDFQPHAEQKTGREPGRTFTSSPGTRLKSSSYHLASGCVSLWKWRKSAFIIGKPSDGGGRDSICRRNLPAFCCDRWENRLVRQYEPPFPGRCGG